MADGGVDIDLYADDIETDFNRGDEFGGENVDLYDDVIGAPSKPGDGDGPANGSSQQHPPEETNGSSYHGHGHHGGNRRFQLYIGNLTWWATDQDIADAIADVGVTDFVDVKFFENRANGQSKGFCVVYLGSENSMRLIMERLPKREIHGQHPITTLPTKQALNQFESQCKTRSTPPGPNSGMRGPPHPGGPPGPHPGEFFGGGPNGPPNGPPGRMMMNAGHHQLRGPPPPHHMPPHHQGGPPPHHMQHQQGPPPQHQGPPPQHRMPMQFQGPPQIHRGPGPRPDWGPRGGPPPHMQQGQHHPPPHHHQPPYHPHQGGPPIGGPPPGHQLPPPHGGVPRAPVPHPGLPPQYPQGSAQVHQMIHNIMSTVPPGAPAPHVNPAFFNQQPPAQQPPPHQSGPPGPGGPPYGHPGHAPPPTQGPPPGARQPYGRPPQNYPPAVEPGRPVGPPMGGHIAAPAMSEAEIEEVMNRNRTVSSSAIARAVSDAAAGEYASAIETLVTAISLIKQSKVAHDDRCKILISSLQDTLHGVETRSYSNSESRSRRSRSRERDARAHHRSAPPRRRERSSSRYRERSRDREERDRYRERSRDRDRDRDRDAYYREYRERERERSRSRDRERADHYNRGHSREERTRKSPAEGIAEGAVPEPSAAKPRAAAAPYYEERYRDRREREPAPAERDRDREHRRERH